MNDTTRAPAAAIAGRTFFRWLAAGQHHQLLFIFTTEKRKEKSPSLVFHKMLHRFCFV
jgi:hypothetical protein